MLRPGGLTELTSPRPRAHAIFLTEDLRAQFAHLRPDLVGESACAPSIEAIWDANQVFKIADRWRLIQFQRFRGKPGDDGSRRLAGAFRLTFGLEVQGLILLGWSSHFGMGLFLLSRLSTQPSHGKL